MNKILKSLAVLAVGFIAGFRIAPGGDAQHVADLEARLSKLEVHFPDPGVLMIKNIVASEIVLAAPKEVEPEDGALVTTVNPEGINVRRMKGGKSVAGGSLGDSSLGFIELDADGAMKGTTYMFGGAIIKGLTWLTEESLTIRNKDAKVVLVLSANDLGSGMLSLGDTDGKLALLAGVGPDCGGGALALMNKTGEQVVSVRSDKDGVGLVQAVNRKGVGNLLEGSRK